MAKSKAITEELEVAIESKPDSVPELEVETEAIIQHETVREWTYSEVARFQLTGEYPDWYITPKT